MMSNTNQPVVQYIDRFADPQRAHMLAIRDLIWQEVPDVAEGISYGMPAYKWKGKPLIYYAAYPHHIGLYATPSGHEAFREQLAGYKQGKGSVQFPIDQPMPLALIAEIVRFRKETIAQQLSSGKK